MNRAPLCSTNTAVQSDVLLRCSSVIIALPGPLYLVIRAALTLFSEVCSLKTGQREAIELSGLIRSSSAQTIFSFLAS